MESVHYESVYVFIVQAQPAYIDMFEVLSVVALLSQWKIISRKQNTRWQHLSWLKANAFISLQKNSYYETHQLILGIGNAM
jgi:hypothetical protein